MDAMALLRSKAPLLTVLTAVAVCVTGFLVMWSRAGGSLPGQGDYQVTFSAEHVKNLQPAGDVRIAGVLVGKVVDQEVDGDRAKVTVKIFDEAAPLHEGATVRVGVKSVIGQSFVDVKDGSGSEIPDRSSLPDEAVIPPVDIDEVVRTFDPRTKKALSGALASLGEGTRGRADNVDQLMEGIGMIGREGYDAIDAIEAQNKDLAALVNEGTTILQALNTGRNQISSLVTNAQSLTNVTASHRSDIEATVRGLPALVDAAGRATGTLDGLAADLQPVASDLDAAAPGLSAALRDLPSVTQDLRALLPHMDSSLGRAHQTLAQVPDLAEQLQAATPDLEELLANANPMLAYLGPYATDIGSFFGNFGASFDVPMENGVQPAHLAPIFNEYSLRNNPLNLQALNPLHWNNPYPAPLSAGDPAKDRGSYPSIDKEE